jgi:hypothetical protein
MVLDDSPVYPAISYTTISSITVPTLSSTGSYRQRVRIDCYSNDYDQAHATREALVAALDGLVTTSGTDFVDPIRLITTGDFYEDQIRVFRLAAEFYLYVFPTA